MPTDPDGNCGPCERWNNRLKLCVADLRGPGCESGVDPHDPAGGIGPCPTPGYVREYPGGPCVPGPPAPPAGGLGPSPCAGLTGAALWACRARNQPRTVTTMVPQTLTDLLARFYTSDFQKYLDSGVLGTGVPQASGSLLDLLLNRSFQNLLAGPPQQVDQTGRGGGVWGPQPPTPVGGGGRGVRGPMPPVPATAGTAGMAGATTPTSVLGLSGGAAAYGYIDPSWMFDRSFRTVWNPVTSVIEAQPQKPNTLPMDGLVSGNPGNPCVGLTGPALWECRWGRARERNREPKVA